jgi:hypothetical protein
MLFKTLVLLLCLTVSALDCAPTQQRNYFAHFTKPFGSPTGTLFSCPIPMSDAETVRKVIVGAGLFVKNIQFEFRDANGNTHLTNLLGASNAVSKTGIQTKDDAATYTWIVPNGEYITKVEVKYGVLLDALTFVTNKGTRSQQFGGDGGALEVVELEGHLVCFLFFFFYVLQFKNEIKFL